MSTTVNYKGSTIATVNNATKTLNTAGTWVEGDITFIDVTPGKYTATLIADGGIYTRYVILNGTKYFTSGETFSFNGGDSLYIYATDTRGGSGAIYIDDVRVVGAQGYAEYTYTLPESNIEVSFGSNSTSVNSVSAISLQSKSVSYTPSETAQSATVTADNGYDGLSSVAVSVGAISSSYVGSGIDRRSSSDLTASGATVTVPSGYYASQATKSVASGTEGTPTATKSSVSNHSVSVTPSVTNAAGYIPGGTKTGTAVTVSASELVSGSETKTANGTYDVTNLASIVIDVSSSGGNIGGLSEMVDVSNSDYSFGYMLSCLKNGDTVGGRVTYTSAFPNTETKILETGLTTIHGIMFSRYDVNVGTNVDGQPNKTIFIFQNQAGTISAIGNYANNVVRVYGQAQGTVQAGVPLNGAVRFSGGDVYYTGRYNKNAGYQMLKTNTEYEWLAW